MLSQKSIPGPTYRDPMVQVEILAAIRVAGRECAVGDTVTMLSSDAQALSASTPPSVAFLK